MKLLWKSLKCCENAVKGEKVIDAVTTHRHSHTQHRGRVGESVHHRVSINIVYLDMAVQWGWEEALPVTSKGKASDGLVVLGNFREKAAGYCIPHSHLTPTYRKKYKKC